MILINPGTVGKGNVLPGECKAGRSWGPGRQSASRFSVLTSAKLLIFSLNWSLNHIMIHSFVPDK